MTDLRDELARLDDRSISTPEAMLSMLRSLRELRFGLEIDQLDHALRCASLAENLSDDPELTVVALCHDVGKLIAPTNHGAVAAAMLAPYVRPELVDVVERHEQVALEMGSRSVARPDGPAPLVDWFVDRLDRPAQRSGAPPPSLDHFAPAVRRVFGRVHRAPAPRGNSAVGGSSSRDDPAETVSAGAARLVGEAALERCVGSVEAFLGEAWGRTVRVRRGRDTFADLFDDRAAESFVRRHWANPGAVRIVDGGTELLDRPRDDIEAVTSAFANGATLALNGLERRWPPVTRFCRQVELFLTMPVQANAYLSPPGARGLASHTDDHDVLVVCVRGSKVFFADGRDVVMSGGDVLYLPAGTPHHATASEEGSLHLTIGIHATRWAALVPALVEHLARHPAAATRLRAGHVYDADHLRSDAHAVAAALADWVAGTGGAVLSELAVEGFVRARPTGYGTSTPLVARAVAAALRSVPTVPDRPALRVQLRPGAIARLTAAGGRWRLVSGSTELILDGDEATVAGCLLTGNSVPLDSLLAYGAPTEASTAHVWQTAELIATLLERGVIEPV